MSCRVSPMVVISMPSPVGLNAYHAVILWVLVVAFGSCIAVPFLCCCWCCWWWWLAGCGGRRMPRPGWCLVQIVYVFLKGFRNVGSCHNFCGIIARHIAAHVANR